MDQVLIYVYPNVFKSRQHNIRSK